MSDHTGPPASTQPAGALRPPRVRPPFEFDFRRRALLKLLGASLLGMAPARIGLGAPRMGLVLPTENATLFSADASRFYMYTDRDFEGVRSQPWQGGQYGYVRNQKRTSSGIVFTRFHEGVDIRPMRRSADGTPLDVVHSIADGKVVYVNDTSANSSYGKYIVVSHDWGYGPFCSLYAHLMSTTAKPGQTVRAGSPLGRLGYTGEGIDKTRAHLHLELNLFLSERFDAWHNLHYRTPNHNDVYNGLNLVGLDIAAVYKAHRANGNLDLCDLVRGMNAYFKVLVPNRGKMEIARRYPWLMRDGSGSSSWLISFNDSGVPLAIEPSGNRVSEPAVAWVRNSPTYHSYHTRGRLTGSGSQAGLSSSGAQYVQLVSGAF